MHPPSLDFLKKPLPYFFKEWYAIFMRKRFFEYSLVLATLYYLCFIGPYFLTTYLVSWSLGNNQGIWVLLLLSLLPPTLSSLLLGMCYTLIQRDKMPYRTRAFTALWAALLPLGLGLIIFLRPLGDMGRALAYGLGIFALIIFSSIILLPPLASCLLLRCGPFQDKTSSHTKV